MIEPRGGFALVDVKGESEDDSCGGKFKTYDLEVKMARAVPNGFFVKFTKDELVRACKVGS